MIVLASTIALHLRESSLVSSSAIGILLGVSMLGMSLSLQQYPFN